MEAWVLGILFLIIVLVGVMLRDTTRPPGPWSGSGEIPKIIWTYWDGDELPWSVQECINSWHKFNPDWDVRIVNRNSLARWTDTPVLKFRWANTPQRTADFVRLELLSKYGGVWADASLLMTRPLDWVLETQMARHCEFVGYTISTSPTETPILENWFFACVTESPFVKAWRDEFFSINNWVHPAMYVGTALVTNSDVRRISTPFYLSMHVAATKVISKMNSDDVHRRLFLTRAEDGPLKHLIDAELDNNLGLETLCQRGDYETPIVKFIGTDRNIIEEKKLACVF